MTLVEMLQNARKLYLDGHYRIGGTRLVSVLDLLVQAACGDKDLAFQGWQLLDACTPGFNFDIYVDGGKWDENVGAIVYHYDTKPHEVAAVIGKAIMRASRPDEERENGSTS